mmetsp:Transcript_4546/g.6118  ORF Transcript_4546/g.6118 Transcript_4546/m.6118 type:complete len:232 (-) Transcript_4546:28-723(-)
MAFNAILVLVHPGTSNAERNLPPFSSLSFISSCSSPSVYVFTIDLDTLYARFPGGMVIPCFEPVFTISPSIPPSFIIGTNAIHPYITPIPLTLTTLSKLVTSLNAPPPTCVAALLNKKCTVPKPFFFTTSQEEVMAEKSETSATIANTLLVEEEDSCCWMDDTDVCNSVSSTSTQKTFIPKSRAHFLLIASPIPDEAPVITATFPGLKYWLRLIVSLVTYSAVGLSVELVL